MPKLYEARETFDVADFADFLKTGVSLSLLLGTGQLAAGVVHTKELGWRVGVEVHTPTGHDMYALTFAKADELAAELTKRAATACPCEACASLYGRFTRDFPRVVDMVRAKVEADAPPPTDEDHERAAASNALFQATPAGRA